MQPAGGGAAAQAALDDLQEALRARGGQLVARPQELPQQLLVESLILALVKRIPQSDKAMRAGGWQESVITEALSGKTLGELMTALPAEVQASAEPSLLAPSHPIRTALAP